MAEVVLVRHARKAFRYLIPLRVFFQIAAGAILNILCVMSVVLATETWGMVLFDLTTPPWNVTTT